MNIKTLVNVVIDEDTDKISEISLRYFGREMRELLRKGINDVYLNGGKISLKEYIKKNPDLIEVLTGTGKYKDFSYGEGGTFELDLFK